MNLPHNVFALYSMAILVETNVYFLLNMNKIIYFAKKFKNFVCVWSFPTLIKLWKKKDILFRKMKRKGSWLAFDDSMHCKFIKKIKMIITWKWLQYENFHESLQIEYLL